MGDELSRIYDGVATVEYQSLEQRNSNRAAAEYHCILQDDERRVFDALVHNFSFIGSHDVLQGPGVGPAKVIRFLRRSRDLSSKEFTRTWRDEYAQRLIGSAGNIRSVAQNLPIPPERPEGWGLKVDGSEKIWFDTLAAADAFRHSEAAREIRAQFEPPLFTVVAEVVVDEVILHDT
ncbi:hypothetical protein [Microvirga puerhi]|uniref:Uncharacterized protein n=1 Tax=Microvirga puerhi TaxID=2876078 RepID=A0ABS7VU63_9HYPH|nr:hypothetical protein [Microvirga puerhi]MBZ6078729.1 hypothetical protein [Microvirga puerhi]